MSLENVQVGDVLVIPGRNLAETRVVEVARLTKTQIILTSGQRFRKSDGDLVGRSSPWSHCCARVPRGGEIAEIRVARLKQKLTHEISGACQINRLRDRTLEQLQQIDAVMKSQELKYIVLAICPDSKTHTLLCGEYSDELRYLACQFADAFGWTVHYPAAMNETEAVRRAIKIHESGQ